MIRLIVNADDLGRTPEINGGILKAFQDGIVTSASLMANFAAFEQAVALHQNFDLPVGIHLNLTEGRPTSPPEHVPSLIDASGRFFQKRHFFVRLLQRRFKAKEIEMELTAQLQQCWEAGVKIDHVDSHHHIHAVPMVRSICDKLRKTFKLPAVRRITQPAAVRLSWAQMEQSLVSLVDQMQANNHNVSPEFFWGFDLMHARDKTAALLSILNMLGPGTHEIMCHPGFVSHEHVGLMNESRQREVAALCSRKARKLVNQRLIELISFRDLI